MSESESEHNEGSKMDTVLDDYRRQAMMIDYLASKQAIQPRQTSSQQHKQQANSTNNKPVDLIFV